MNEHTVLARHREKLIYRDGDKLVKLFGEHYSKSDILNEAINQARVAETGLAIPKLYDVTTIDGKTAIVMDFIEGDTLKDLFFRYPERQGEFLSLYVALHREVHAKKHLLLTKYIDKLKLKILAGGLDASTRYDLSMRLDDMRRHTHVLHGDFLPSNIILTRDGTPYILDWSHASQGNATADVVKSCLLLRLAGAEEFAEDYLTRYLSAAHIERAYADEWVPLIAAARLSRETDPAVRARLLKWTYGEE